MKKIFLQISFICLVNCCFTSELFAAGKKDVSTTSTIDVANTQNADAATAATPDSDAVEDWPSSLEPEDSGAQKIAYRREAPSGEPAKFHEVWAYVIDGREQDFTENMPVTDLCIFSASVNIYGEINYIPDPSRIKNYKGRKHLVVTCDSRALTHFVLDPSYGVRKSVVAQLAKAARKYDGLQIDFELVPLRDAKNFRTFLSEVRARIGKEKWFSVALPARVRDIADDVYNYKLIAPCVDRIIIMAYDEHWGGSKPGPVAGYDWCEKVVDYAATTMPAKKLVMGLPFYGRTWLNESPAGAYRFESINTILNDNNIHSVTRDEGQIPSFTYNTLVTVTGYFDDTQSLLYRSRMYESKNVQRVAFWRVGQEDSTFWKWIQLK